MEFIFRLERKVGKLLIHIFKHIKCINTYCNVSIFEVQMETMYLLYIIISLAV